MTKYRTHTLKHSRDPDGTEIIGVLIENAGKYAWLRKVDYDRIVEKYGVCAWTIGANSYGSKYVHFKTGRPVQRCVYVGRAVAGAVRGQAVRFKDGNTLNLRLSNLYYDAGRGGEAIKPEIAPPKRRSPLSIPATVEGEVSHA